MPSLLCPQCGKTVPADAPGSLCPACLIQLGLAEDRTLLPVQPREMETVAGSSVVSVVEPAASETVRIPGYEVLSELGRGGMGVVYKARHLNLKRLVALKMIVGGEYATPDQLDRFRREAEAVARLQHPNIVQIHEVSERDGRPYFSLEFVDGGSLADRLGGTPLPPVDAAKVVATLARAVHAAHQCGIIHRDLKPSNVLMTAAGTPKIADFGLAKETDSSSSKTQEGTVVGTPSYMAPEQAGGEVRSIGPAADTYALGAILYETLTGRPPFKGVTSLDTVMQVISLDPTPPSALQPQVPGDLETICLKCLHKEPGRRYASALELAEDLQRFLANEPILARPTSALERLRKWSRRHPAAAGLSAALMVVFVTAFALVTWKWQEADRAGKLDRELAQEAEKRADAEKKRVEEEKKRADAEKDRATVADNLRKEETKRADAEKQKAEAEKKTADTERQRLKEVAQALEKSEQQGFTSNIRLAAGLIDSDPKNALKILEDRGLCPPERRDFPWRYQYQLGQRQVRTMAPLDQSDGRSYGYRSAVSRDGRLLAAVVNIPAGTPGTKASAVVQMWDLDKGKAGALLEVNHGSNSVVAISPDNKLLASGGKDGLVKLWELPAGKLKSTLRWQIADDKDKPREISSLAFDPSGKKLAVGGHYFDKEMAAKPVDSDGRYRYFVVWVWDIAGGSGKKLAAHDSDASFKTHGYHDQAGIWCLAYSADGNILALGTTRPSAVWLLDPASGKLVTSFRRQAGWVEAMAFSADGKLFAYGNSTSNVFVIELDSDLSKSKVRHTLYGHQSDIHTCAFTEDRALVTGANDGTIRVWDPGSGQLRTVFRCAGNRVQAMGLRAHDRQAVALTLNGAEFWSLRVAAPALAVSLQQDKLRGATTPVAFDDEGMRFAVAGQDNQVRLWNLTHVLAPKGSGGFYIDLRGPWFSRITASAAAPLAGHKGRTTAVAFGPKGSNLAVSGGEDGQILVWRLHKEKPEVSQNLTEHRGAVTYLEVLRDGKSFISGTGDDVRLWDLETGQSQPFPKEATALVRPVLSKDGKRLATISRKGPVLIWDVDKLALVKTLPLLHYGPVTWLAWNPEGTRLATATNRFVDPIAATHNISRGVVVRDLTDDTAHVHMVLPADCKDVFAMTPDFRTIAVASDERTVRLYDLVSGHLRGEIPVLSHHVYGLSFNHDATLLATVSLGHARWDLAGEVKLWAASPP